MGSPAVVRRNGRCFQNDKDNLSSSDEEDTEDDNDEYVKKKPRIGAETPEPEGRGQDPGAAEALDQKQFEHALNTASMVDFQIAWLFGEYREDYGDAREAAGVATATS